MNFKINKETLLNNLNIVIKAIPSRTAMPHLECIKFDILDDFIELTTTNNEIVIKNIIKTDILIKDKGSFLVPAKIFIELVKNFDNCDINLFLQENKILVIEANNNEYRLNILDSNEYPILDLTLNNEQISINKEILSNIIKTTAFAASNNNINQALLGVNFKSIEKDLIITATNAYRLSQKIIKNINFKDFDILIPAKSLMELEKILDFSKSKEILFSIKQNTIIFTMDNIIFQTRLIKSEFPKILDISTKDYDIIFKLNKNELLTSLNRISLLASSDNLKDREVTNNKIYFKSSKDSYIELEAFNKNGKGIEKIQTLNNSNNQSFKIGFSSKYLIEALKVINEDEVEIFFKNPTKPFIVKPKNDDYFKQMIIPFIMEK